MSQGMIYNIQRMSIQDGPGLRTTVFLKGCPLRCIWCSNPESQLTKPQVMCFENLCSGCGNCMEACPNDAVIPKDGVFGRDIAKCTDCGACVESCPTEARELSGKMMRVEEVMDVVRKDSLFYENSGGGVTFGGGEPTAGGQFFLDLLEAAVGNGYHVTVDTCGVCPADRFDKTIELADLFLFDCKHMDPEQHKKLTGMENTLILRNMRAALSSNKEVRIRMPLMPGMNDSEENIAAMATFLKEFGKTKVEVMPYHAFGKGKYAALSMVYPEITAYDPEQLKGVLQRFTDHGLTTEIV